ncbi:MAG: tripartite tricarboxylate transporter substrate binding protein [Burkholderiales bacterium]
MPHRSAAVRCGPAVFSAAVLTLCAGLQTASAQQTETYPAKAVRWVVPFAAGGPVDLMSRAVAERLSQRWHQPVVMDFRPGAGGTIGTGFVAKAPPDGYTLMTGHVGTHAINATLYPQVPYDAVRDFTPISLIAEIPFAVLVHPSVPAKSVKELIALAKARPGDLNYASAGIGGPTHLIPEYFKSVAGIDIVHVSYKGNAAALAGVVSGEAQLMFSNFLTSTPLVQAGRMRLLATSAQQRSARMPDLPTISESGIPGFHATAWYGALAPAGLPQPLLQKLHADITAVLSAPDLRERFGAQSIDLVTTTPAGFAALIKSEIPKWGKIVRSSGAKPG